MSYKWEPNTFQQSVTNQKLIAQRSKILRYHISHNFSLAGIINTGANDLSRHSNSLIRNFKHASSALFISDRTFSATQFSSCQNVFSHIGVA